MDATTINDQSDEFSWNFDAASTCSSSLGPIERWLKSQERYSFIQSRVMYGAPVWADDLMASHRSILLLRRLHRATAIRIVRGYRTVSHASATVLVASPPWKLRALVLKRRYIHMRLWDPGEDSTEQAAPKDLGTAEDNA
ncbi:uncharacterized protein LOC122575574 isoform X2 [Bombus pyrosoma]|uniref:uncharacterized protein LOC122575574 isoform X2 n=1 Tax=Bombus pyrosoma TaxID=396416 RepID=UPI001CB997F3|nr:uncharacterized protein LOC122575574 isoform X2 [Bombus pyrosoma]